MHHWIYRETPFSSPKHRFTGLSNPHICSILQDSEDGFGWSYHLCNLGAFTLEFYKLKPNPITYDVLMPGGVGGRGGFFCPCWSLCKMMWTLRRTGKWISFLSTFILNQRDNTGSQMFHVPHPSATLEALQEPETKNNGYVFTLTSHVMVWNHARPFISETMKEHGI